MKVQLSVIYRDTFCGDIQLNYIQPVENEKQAEQFAQDKITEEHLDVLNLPQAGLGTHIDIIWKIIE